LCCGALEAKRGNVKNIKAKKFSKNKQSIRVNCFEPSLPTKEIIYKQNESTNKITFNTIIPSKLNNGEFIVFTDELHKVVMRPIFSKKKTKGI
jgi:hypothetical protein